MRHPAQGRTRQVARLLRRCADSRALAALDIALVFPAVLGLVLALPDIAAAVLAQGALDNAVTRAATRVERGTLPPGDTPAALRADVCAFASAPLMPGDACDAGLLLDVRALTGGSAPAPISGGAINLEAFGSASGGAGDLLLVRAALRVPTFLPAQVPFLANLTDGARLVVSSAVTRIDPYATYNARGAP
ncbi:MAG: hypothetical protein AB1698_11420 [Pseudomonadota bacterium]